MRLAAASVMMLFALVEASLAQMPVQPANTLADLKRSIGRCWQAAPKIGIRPDTEVTLRLALRRDGTVLGEPRVTFVSRDANEQTRSLYANATVNSLRACAPFQISETLGGAIAGRIFTFRFIYNTAKPAERPA